MSCSNSMDSLFCQHHTVLHNVCTILAPFLYLQYHTSDYLFLLKYIKYLLQNALSCINFEVNKTKYYHSFRGQSNDGFIERKPINSRYFLTVFVYMVRTGPKKWRYNNSHVQYVFH